MEDNFHTSWDDNFNQTMEEVEMSAETEFDISPSNFGMKGGKESVPGGLYSEAAEKIELPPRKEELVNDDRNETEDPIRCLGLTPGRPPIHHSSQPSRLADQHSLGMANSKPEDNTEKESDIYQTPALSRIQRNLMKEFPSSAGGLHGSNQDESIQFTPIPENQPAPHSISKRIHSEIEKKQQELLQSRGTSGKRILIC